MKSIKKATHWVLVQQHHYLCWIIAGLCTWFLFSPLVQISIYIMVKMIGMDVDNSIFIVSSAGALALIGCLVISHLAEMATGKLASIVTVKYHYQWKHE
ncbi:hypothetical protein [Erwinia phage Snitter]|nr:hypothetical protein [Erwinia phage Snitter]